MWKICYDLNDTGLLRNLMVLAQASSYNVPRVIKKILDFKYTLDVAQ